MNEPFLKKYKPKRYKDFVIDPEYINLLSTLVQMDSLNILLIGDSSCGKTSLLDATILEYIVWIIFQKKMFFLLITCKNKVYQFIEQG